MRAALHARFHEARSEIFVRLMRPTRGQRLLDLGGGDGSLAQRIVGRVPLSVTVADLSEEHRDGVVARGFAHQVVHAGDALPFEDGEFDIVLSNSVIEHATLPKARCRVTERVRRAEWAAGSRAAQRALAAEIRRVGRGYFVQTPHKHFPIDQHIQLPLVHYLSHNAACRLVSFTDRWWVKKCQGTVDWELLTVPDMARLFPDGTLHVEHFLGLPKSIIAWRPAAS